MSRFHARLKENNEPSNAAILSLQLVAMPCYGVQIGVKSTQARTREFSLQLQHRLRGVVQRTLAEHESIRDSN